jgi:hypothetical protein
MIDWHSKDGPWLYVNAATSSRLWDRATSLAAPGTTVRWLRGKKMSSYAGMFDEVSAALQFPWYFGGNSAAFDECMSDLSWLPQGRLAIFIDGLLNVLVDESPVEWQLFMDQMIDICHEHASRGSGYSMRVISGVNESENIDPTCMRKLGMRLLSA